MTSSKPRKDYTLGWTTPALRDLLEIVEYIRSDNAAAASRFAKDVHAKVSRLARFPLSGRFLPEFPMTGLREVVIGNYRVIYQVVPSARQVHILTVRHGARRLDIESPAP